jgi:ribosomal-protein-alanine N-acetyltransferase
MFASRQAWAETLSRHQSSSWANEVSGLVNAKFRLAATADIGALVDLENRSFSSDRISRESFRRLVKAPSAAVIVAGVGRSLAGYAVVLFRAGSAAARIYSLAVDPAFRGIGRELLAACENEAARRGASAVRLEVREDNFRAISLYERMSYSRFAAKPGYYADGATALRFAKRIEPRAGIARLAGTAAA